MVLQDTLPGQFNMKKVADAQDFKLEASFTGSVFTDQFGNKMPGNREVRVKWVMARVDNSGAREKSKVKSQNP